MSKRTLIAALIAASCIFLVTETDGSAASDRTIAIDSAEALRAALESSRSGATIELAPGQYGSLEINVPYGDPWGEFAGEVTIRSADPDHPASFSSIYLRGVANLTLDGIAIHYTLPAGAKHPLHEIAVTLRDASNIEIRNSVLIGDIENDPASLSNYLPVAIGLKASGSHGIVVEKNEFSSWYRGAVFSDSSDLMVAKNDVHTIRSDGFDFSAVNDVVIEGNRFHDFVTREGVKDHRDMIQFWTNGTTSPSTDITIRDNILNSGSGAFTQSIFMRNEMVDSHGAGHEMFYRNVLIENNLIYNAQSHGITVGEADRLTISHNTLLHNPGSGDRGSVSRPRIKVADRSRNVLVTYNVAEAVPEPADNSVGWVVAYNLIVQDKNPRKPNYYGDLFVSALAGGQSADLAGLQALPGGVIEQAGYGSSLTRLGCRVRCDPQ